MKKLTAILLTALFIMGGCSQNEVKEKVTMDKIVNEFVNEFGVEVETEKPYFQMIMADDGNTFYIDNQKVAIYEFSSEKKLKESLAEFDLEYFETNGVFALETQNEQAKGTFNQVFEQVE